MSPKVYETDISSKPRKSVRKGIMSMFISALAVSWMINARLVQISTTIYENYSSIRMSKSFCYLCVFNATMEKEIHSSSATNQLEQRDNIHHVEVNLTSNESKRAQMEQLAVFYNVYISDESPATAHRIIREQIKQVGESYLASSHINTTIYYATLGRMLPDGFMERICKVRNGLRCQHLRHYEEGYEEVTLASLYDYCKNHSNERVVYFHSKGKRANHCIDSRHS